MQHAAITMTVYYYPRGFHIHAQEHELFSQNSSTGTEHYHDWFQIDILEDVSGTTSPHILKVTAGFEDPLRYWGYSTIGDIENVHM